MKSSEFNQAISFKVYAQDHTRADKTNAIYLRVIIDRLKKEFNLKVYWPKQFFDGIKQIALPRHGKDADVAAVNMVIAEAKGRASRIKLRYFGDSKLLSLDAFAKEFENYESRDNFLFYWENKINDVVNEGSIVLATGVRHRTNLNRFKLFTKQDSFFSMGDINAELLQKYNRWLSKSLQFNTVVASLKCLQTYVNHALADGYKIDVSFKKMNLRYIAGDRAALEPDEVKRLRALFAKKTLPHLMQEVLRKFLFSCFTGIRISDSANVHVNSPVCSIKNGTMKIKLVKGKRYGKEVIIPLPAYARELIAGKKGLIFEPVADQTCNDMLKIIMDRTEPPIEKVVSFHVSRDTFATTFIAMGGDVYTLKELLGQSDIRTTSIYVKMSENRKGALMANFDSL